MNLFLDQRLAAVATDVLNFSTLGDPREAKLKTLQRAYQAMRIASEHLQALETLSDIDIIDRAEKEDADVQSLLRYLILRDIVFRTAPSSLSQPPTEMQSQPSPSQ